LENIGVLETNNQRKKETGENKEKGKLPSKKRHGRQGYSGVRGFRRNKEGKRIFPGTHLKRGAERGWAPIYEVFKYVIRGNWKD